MKRLREWAQSLKRETLALYYAVRDPRTPWAAKLVAGFIVAYAISPIDLIPDFIPVLGYLDDMVILPLGIWLALRLIPEPVLTQARLRAVASSERPTSRTALFVILALWLAAVLACSIWLLDVGCAAFFSAASGSFAADARGARRGPARGVFFGESDARGHQAGESYKSAASGRDGSGARHIIREFDEPYVELIRLLRQPVRRDHPHVGRVHRLGADAWTLARHDPAYPSYPLPANPSAFIGQANQIKDPTVLSLAWLGNLHYWVILLLADASYSENRRIMRR